MSESGPQPKELEDLEKTLNSGVKAVNIRLREGEYQFGLAKTIASFELELCFPDVKDLVKKLFGETKTEDPQFLSKIQTILKKMEKSGIVKILPKDKPWELQRYALSAFRFQDVEKNTVVLATETEIENAKKQMRSQTPPDHESKHRTIGTNVSVFLLLLIVIVSYGAILWVLTQPAVELMVFVPSFCIAVACSILLGIRFSRK